VSLAEVKNNRTYWYCRCSCGQQKAVAGQNLQRGDTKSCGCLALEIRTKHGLSSHPMKIRWSAMNDRCFKPSNVRWNSYGGRGITVCDRWSRYRPNGLKNFINDMYSTFKEGLELDRIDVNGNYEPSNCRWATSSENAKNRQNKATKQSKFPGVHWDKQSNKWTSKLDLGRFTSEVQAHEIYSKLKDYLKSIT
jgi:hypothetical protein